MCRPSDAYTFGHPAAPLLQWLGEQVLAETGTVAGSTLIARRSSGSRPLGAERGGGALVMYPPIESYAFLSDCEISCLLAPDGSVEWLCLPRPDSPSLFGALLDRRAGFFRFAPNSTEVPDQRRYVPGTNVLETTWHTPSGWLTVHDLLVVGPPDSTTRRDAWRRVPSDDTAQGLLLRIATCFDGRVEVEANCLALYDYGRTPGTWTYDDSGYGSVTAEYDDVSLRLGSSLRLGAVGARAYGRTTLHQGESAWIALSWGGSLPTDDEDAFRQLRQTEQYWRDWLSRASIPDNAWRPYIERSALALKGLSYAPTGAIMAAATTSLPETPGGERNWDYRYTWIRDSGFMLRALHALGFDFEAFEYFAFVVDTLTSGPHDDDWRLQIMYGIGGETDLTEHVLEHLSGYADSRPVRIGNGAYDQQQHDVWGMLLDALFIHTRRGGAIPPATWEGVAALVDEAIERAPEPDQGIWEMRGEPKHFVASKVLCWVAADRGARLGRRNGDAPRAQRWQASADSIKAEVLEKGVDERGVFVQHYDAKDLDASNLLIPIMGFLPPDDERVRATVLAIADELTKDGLVLRYRTDVADDGLSNEEEGTFTICSFWLVSALAMIGETERAHELFGKLLSFAGPLLLYAEEIDVASGHHLGNFPQAFTHLALIDAALRLAPSEPADP
jgi:GH15 family glucan-1,4-alpha-glucosidase